MEVTLTKISTHGKTQKGSSAANGGMIGVTTKGHGQYTIVHGSGRNRVSETMHCSEAFAENYKKQLQERYK